MEKMEQNENVETTKKEKKARKRHKFPTLSHKDFVTMLSKLTGLDERTCAKMKQAYEQIVYETLTHGCEVRVTNIGTFSFRDYPPMPEREGYSFYAGKRLTLLPTKGFLALKFNPLEKFKSKLKRVTSYGGLPLREYIRRSIELYGEKSPYYGKDEEWIENFIRENEEDNIGYVPYDGQ